MDKCDIFKCKTGRYIIYSSYYIDDIILLIDLLFGLESS